MQITFVDAYNQYLKYVDIKQKEQSKNTLKEKFKNHILPFFKDYNIYDIKEVDYINFQSYIESKGLSYNTKKIYIFFYQDSLIIVLFIIIYLKMLLKQ